MEEEALIKEGDNVKMNGFSNWVCTEVLKVLISDGSARTQEFELLYTLEGWGALPVRLTDGEIRDLITDGHMTIQGL